MTKVCWDKLEVAALLACQGAYAPYSKYRVGVAVLAEDREGAPRVFTGANVENASYGLTMCAERNAIASAVNAGCRKFRGLVLVTLGPKPGVPCGACRQVMSEFPPSFPVRCLTLLGNRITNTNVAALLPWAFGPGDLSNV